MIKINFDGSVSITNRRGGIEVIARDNNREVMGILQASIRRITDPVSLKLMLLLKLYCLENKWDSQG